MNFFRRHYLIIIILLVATFLRLYRISSTQTFLEDEGRDLLISYRMIDTFRPVLLGPQTSTGNMYLGPLYYYLTTPALLLSGLNPLGPSVFIALSGVFTTYLLFLIGRKIFSTKVGYFAAALYAAMPLAVVFTRNSWNPNLAPLFALLMYYLTDRITCKNHHTRWDFFFLGFCAGALIQMHYLGLLYLLSTAVILFFSLYKKPASLLKGIIFGLLGLLIILSPFIVFEVRNDFVNTRAISRFITAKEEHNIRYALPIELWSKKVGFVTTRLFSSAFGRDSLTNDPYRLPITVIIGTIYLVGYIASFRKRNKTGREFRLLFYLVLIPLLLTGIYQENIHLHYLGFFFPLLYLLAASSIYSMSKPLITLLIVIGLVAYSLPQLVSYLGSNSTNQVIRAQEVANYIIAKAKDQPYNVVSASGTPTTPYLYFLAISSARPTNDKALTVFMICQGSECSTSDINSPFIFITGQAHPTISQYLGHPLSNYYEGPRRVISNEHVSHGAWVAELVIE